MRKEDGRGEKGKMKAQAAIKEHKPRRTGEGHKSVSKKTKPKKSPVRKPLRGRLEDRGRIARGCKIPSGSAARRPQNKHARAAQVQWRQDPIKPEVEGGFFFCCL